MSMATPLRLALREMRGGLRDFPVLLICLALGVAAIAGVGSIRAAIQSGLTSESARILGGDAQMQFTYRFASDQERAWMADQAVEISELADFRSMASVMVEGQTERALTQVKAVDAAYPLYGAVMLEPAMPLAEALETRDLPGLVAEAVLLDRLGVGLGDVLSLGTQAFEVRAILLREPDNAGSGFSFGPKSLVQLDALEASGLLAPGTLFDSVYRLRLPDGADLEGLEETAEAKFAQTGLRWRDTRNASPLGAVVPLILGRIFASDLPVPAVFAVYPRPLLEAAFYGGLTAVIFSLWPLVRAKETRAAGLFRDASEAARQWPSARWIAVIALLLALLIGVSAWLSGIPVLSLWVSAGVGASFLLLLLAAFGVYRLARRLARAHLFRGRPATHLALRAIGAPGNDTGAVMLSLGLGLTVLAAIAQIDANLQGRIRAELPQISPSYFMVDIQNAQLDGFLDLTSADEAVSEIETAPMLRGIGCCAGIAGCLMPPPCLKPQS